MFKFHVGDIVTTKPSRKRVVSRMDGKYLYFDDGTQYAFTHPDIIGVEHPEQKTEKSPEIEEKTEEKPKKKKKKEPETED